MSEPKSEEATQPTQARHVPVAVGKRGIAFTQLDEMIRFANGLIYAGMVPPGMKAGGVVAIIQAGAEIGMPAMWSLAHLTFVKGKLGIDGTAALALVRNAGVCPPDGQPTFEFEGEPFTPGWTAVVTAQRRDRACPVSYRFSLGDAIRMGLVQLDEKERRIYGRGKGGWTEDAAWATATADMLQWRAWGRMHKREFPDVTMGLSLLEELSDKAPDLEDELEVATARQVRRAPELEAGGGLDPLLSQLESRGQVEEALIVEKGA